ncbi:MAG: hypothetical protein M5R42_15820 [Rhodocyclaceae bacterium]|nr:hypothetical protein [Rhodocyclaceae bacterium]
MAEAQAGQEVGVGQNDFITRLPDCLQVGVLDVAAVAQVVANQEAARTLPQGSAMTWDG